ncbi:arylsulfatase B-like [Schistocerca serialis cubense]|uniref:arylsulfatase B-like n=1 Tax=Schistocerca serialis cubense TaxID=2023355 RepID=UPI00214E6D65|nr:arylsulfatase B-like [Schistocerca serialis cubense]XP_049956681.1 arylsulfatase B-like [Schistocerca serialis cubense]
MTSVPTALRACALLLLLAARLRITTASVRPHIIFIVADDLGWNDVSFHGSDQIPTPNIDALAFNGIILNNHYVQPVCTPTRASLMTGRYPIHLGMQGYPLMAAEPRGMPEGKILPQYLKDLGYVTRAVGKWHLGYYRKQMTPTFRGFDSHFGYYGGFVSYYDYILQDVYNGTPYSGFGLRRNLSVAWDKVGQYATDVFTEEAVSVIEQHDDRDPLFLYLAHVAPHAGNRGKLLEAPQDVINRFPYIPDPDRRTYAAMIAKLDESVGRVMTALQDRDMLDNSIVVFISDNGAPTIGTYPNWGSNWPLRGVKETLWEGSVKGVALMWSNLLHQTPRVSHQLMHVSDWLPTLYSAAGGNTLDLARNMDGVDQWESLLYNLVSRRDEVLINIDEKTRNAAIRLHNWKLVIGTTRGGRYDGYFGASGREDPATPPYNATAVVASPAGAALAHAMQVRYRRPTREDVIATLRASATVRCEPNSTFNAPPCNPAQSGEPCLYDVASDPCELNNLARTYDNVALHLRQQLVRRRAGLVPQANLPVDAAGADPRRWNFTWIPWGECSPPPGDPQLCVPTPLPNRPSDYPVSS